MSPGDAVVRRREPPELVYPTKALTKFLASAGAKPARCCSTSGPVVGANVTFFGEQLGCKIFVEDLFADIERHAAEGKLDELPGSSRTRFTQEPGSVDGILCWDVLDFLDAPRRTALAAS